MSTLTPISKEITDTNPAVVYVHGLWGDSLSTWTNEDSNFYWPYELQRELNFMNVWVYDYPATIFDDSEYGSEILELFQNSSAKHNTIETFAKNLISQLQTEGLHKAKKITFVTHSLGGIVIKQLIRKLTESSKNEPVKLSILSKIKGIIFLSTPHNGSILANIANVLHRNSSLIPSSLSVKNAHSLAYFLGSGIGMSILKNIFGTNKNLLDEISSNSSYLLNLSQWYCDYTKGGSILHQTFLEKKKYLKLNIINSSSPNQIEFGQHYKVNEDHFSICKPRSKNSTVYKYTKNFICTPTGEVKTHKSIRRSLKKINNSPKNFLKSNSALAVQLKKCSEIAKSECKISTKIFNSTSKNLNSLSSKIRVEWQSLCKKKIISRKTQTQYNKIENFLTSEIGKEICKIEDDLKRKEEILSEFTITLFGRTMTGKSTIREAITNGSGKTIGKGAQNTTKNSRPYYWNGLRILDTPGIGSPNGLSYKKKAYSVIDESDIILFLVSSDGIQETEFASLKEILGNRNKPLVVVLNVKLNINNSVYRNRILTNPEKIFERRKIDGHINRINRFLKKYDLSDVNIYPIHAMAAFQSTKESKTNVSKLLRKNSKIDSLFDRIIEEINKHGKVRRLQTFVDSTAIKLRDFVERLHSFANQFEQKANIPKAKILEFDHWREKFISDAKEEFDCKIRIYTNTSRSKLFELVDQFSKNKTELDSKLNTYIAKKEKDFCNQVETTFDHLMSDATYRCKVLEREIVAELEISNKFNMKYESPSKPTDWKKIMGIVADTIKFVSRLIPNPIVKFVGWGISKIVSFFSSDMDDIKEKNDMYKKKVFDDISRKFSKKSNKHTRTFNKNLSNISKKLEIISNDINTYCDILYKIVNMLKIEALNIDNEYEYLNHRLLIETGNCLDPGQYDHLKIGKVVRFPGKRTKFKWQTENDSELFCEVVGKALNENIDGVLPNSLPIMISSALKPAKVNPKNVKTVSDNSYRVELPEADFELANGKDEYNISLVNKLLNVKVELHRS